MKGRIMIYVCLLWIVLTVVGCTSQFSKKTADTVGHQCRAWSMKSADRYDYFEYLNADGRITDLGYDTDGDGNVDLRVSLEAMNTDPQNPHYVILLDGIPYDLVVKMIEEGHFRLFYPPSRVVGPFPSMTDTAYTELFMPGELNGFEAMYYDRDKKVLSDGDTVYLRGENEPWAKKIDYRASMLLDPIGYLNPDFVFNHELSAIEKMIDSHPCGTSIGYSVGTSNMGTRKGEAGLRICLNAVDQLCEKIVYERKGRCRITLMADHGHNLKSAKYFSMTSAVKSCGYRPVRKLEGPKDVVVIEFGLVTNSAMYTDDPDGLAKAILAKYDETELAIYPMVIEGERKIVVRSRNGLAYINKKANGYTYEKVAGDPLQLDGIIGKLKSMGKVSKTGVIDDKAFFEATVDFEYPDALARIWRGFNGLVKYPADLVVTIRDGWYCGKPGFAKTINVASTHGSLNRMNTETFVMTTIGPLPKAIRICDVPRAVPDMLNNNK